MAAELNRLVTTLSSDPPWVTSTWPSSWMNETGDELVNMTSSSMPDNKSIPTYMTLLMTLACGLILVVGLVGNCLVPVVIWNNRDLRNSTNLFLLNLSLADILVLCVSMPTVLIEMMEHAEAWIFGKFMCKFLFFWFVVLWELLAAGRAGHISFGHLVIGWLVILRRTCSVGAPSKQKKNLASSIKNGQKRPASGYSSPTCGARRERKKKG